jgi:hypothetical protein
MEAHLASWIVLALLSICLIAAANRFFAKRLWLMAVVLNWRETSDGGRNRYYAMLALCGNGDSRHRLETQEVEVSRADYILASNTTECLAVDCSVGFLTGAITVKSPTLRHWWSVAA